MVAVNDSIVPGWDSPDYFRLFSEGSPANESTRPGRSAASFGLPGSHGGSNGTGGGGGGGSSAGSPGGGSVGSGNNSATVAAAVANGAYQVYYPGDPEGSRNDTRIGSGGERGEPGGSNFMLLLEDFGEYFYNYNGTGPPNDTLGLGGTSTDFPINCTVANSTCDVPSEGE